MEIAISFLSLAVFCGYGLLLELHLVKQGMVRLTFNHPGKRLLVISDNTDAVDLYIMNAPPLFQGREEVIHGNLLLSPLKKLLLRFYR